MMNMSADVEDINFLPGSKIVSFFQEKLLLYVSDNTMFSNSCLFPIPHRQGSCPATPAGRASLNVLNWKSVYKVYSEAAGCRQQTVIFYLNIKN